MVALLKPTSEVFNGDYGNGAAAQSSNAQREERSSCSGSTLMGRGRDHDSRAGPLLPFATNEQPASLTGQMIVSQYQPASDTCSAVGRFHWFLSTSLRFLKLER